jgi:hypothetical protein
LVVSPPSAISLVSILSCKSLNHGSVESENSLILGAFNKANAFCLSFAIPDKIAFEPDSIPPANVSNNFIDKYNNSLPWAIVAGTRRGIISGQGLVGVEYNFSKEDRDNLEPFGINPIIFQRGSGITIYANKTAQQNIKSSLSQIHAREVMIYIQDGFAAILKGFLFEYNTPQTRLEIKTLADNFLQSVLADNGIVNFVNIMDETNNTPEIIDSNMAIIDSYIEIVKGMEALVHRTTILKTGQIATGQFI